MLIAMCLHKSCQRPQSPQKASVCGKWLIIFVKLYIYLFILFYIFSSPVHESSRSVIVTALCPASGVRQHFLLCNRQVNWDENFTESILSMSSPEFLNIFGIHAEFWFPWQRNEKTSKFYGYSANLKNLLLQKCRADFQIILQKCSLGDPLSDSFKPC